MKNPKRVMVDMSATIIHHGHIRLLREASLYGSVVVALTTDSEVQKAKGYRPELNFAERKEILESIRYVDSVVPSPWLINDDFLDKNGIDFLLHGHDNSNPVSSERMIILNRTEGISSSIIRERVFQTIAEKKFSKKKL